MDEQRRAQLKSLTPEERSKRLNEGLQRRREEWSAKARLQGMETWLAELSALCESVVLDGSSLTMRVDGKVVEATLVEDFKYIFEWMVNHFPHGSTIWWRKVA